MGCDIHAYLDYEHIRKKMGKYDKDPLDSVRDFGEVDISRDYLLFTIMAGVRSYGSNIQPVVEPRGMPADMGYTAEKAYWRYVIDDNDKSTDEGYVKRSSAEKWVAGGSSVWRDPATMSHVSDPDSHTHSYLYLDEMKEVLRRYIIESRKASKEYYDTEMAKPLRPGENLKDKTRLIKSICKGWDRNDTVTVLKSIIGAMKGLNSDKANKARLVFLVR